MQSSCAIQRIERVQNYAFVHISYLYPNLYLEIFLLYGNEKYIYIFSFFKLWEKLKRIYYIYSRSWMTCI
jgi:hypothetical protein